MHQNTFLTTPDIKKYFLKNLILVVWNYAQRHHNTFLTTPDVEKWWPGNASKHGFNHSRR
jgi:hypothetical protein